MKCNPIRDLVSGHVYEDVLSILDQPIPWERMNGKTVFLTGAGGFISYYMVLAMLTVNDLHNTDIHVIGLVRNYEKAAKKYGPVLEREDFTLVTQDVCQDITIEEKADFVIHAASQASAWHFEHDPVGTIRANVEGTIKVLEYAKRCESEASLMISSLKTYGAVSDGSDCLKEETTGYLDHTSYKNCYAMGKRVAETICASYHKQYDMPVRIARPSYIYGPASLNDDRVWAQFIANVVRRQDILLKSNGAAYRSFCYVTDTASALFMILLCGEDVMPYNIANQASDTTIRNFARTAVSVFPERNLKLAFANKEDEAEPVLSFGSTPEILDSTRLQSLGWKPHIDLKEGIRRSVQIV
ncbi:MAG: NAD-dependent epimerase/dehydratase family protein, partial [Lachnospiraceae bacterium]